MKKVMMAALALTLVGGAAFAQNTTKEAPKQEAKKEHKAEAKAHHKMKKAAKKADKAEAAPAETAK